ncbi:hypothetical protein MPER_06698, partial [Moniliophthora perniciosa FA553]
VVEQALLTNRPDEVIIVVDPDKYNKWKDGALQVFHSNQGNQGILGHASKQQLENEFGSSKDIDVVQKMLELGKSQPGKFTNYTFQTNAAKGSMVIDNKGGRSTTGI